MRELGKRFESHNCKVIDLSSISGIKRRLVHVMTVYRLIISSGTDIDNSPEI